MASLRTYPKDSYLHSQPCEISYAPSTILLRLDIVVISSEFVIYRLGFNAEFRNAVLVTGDTRHSSAGCLSQPPDRLVSWSLHHLLVQSYSLGFFFQTVEV